MDSTAAGAPLVYLLVVTASCAGNRGGVPGAGVLTSARLPLPAPVLSISTHHVVAGRTYEARK